MTNRPWPDFWSSQAGACSHIIGPGCAINCENAASDLSTPAHHAPGTLEDPRPPNFKRQSMCRRGGSRKADYPAHALIVLAHSLIFNKFKAPQLTLPANLPVRLAGARQVYIATNARPVPTACSVSRLFTRTTRTSSALPSQIESEVERAWIFLRGHEEVRLRQIESRAFGLGIQHPKITPGRPEDWKPCLNSLDPQTRVRA